MEGKFQIGHGHFPYLAVHRVSHFPCSFLQVVLYCISWTKIAKSKRPPGKHPTQRFVRQQFKMNEKNEILHDKEEEDSDKDPDLKQAAETQQPSPQPNIEQHTTKKNKKSNQKCSKYCKCHGRNPQRSGIRNTLANLAVATLPASAGNNSRGLQSQIYADTRQVQASP